MRRDARPMAIEPPRKSTALAMISTTLTTLTVPACTRLETTARMTSPRTSSMTAAPRTICASGIFSLPRSRKTRPVMPTEVAASVAPRNR